MNRFVNRESKGGSIIDREKSGRELAQQKSLELKINKLKTLILKAEKMLYGFETQGAPEGPYQAKLRAFILKADETLAEIESKSFDAQVILLDQISREGNEQGILI